MGSKSRIVGIDLGTKCGYAALEGRKRIASGEWNLLSSRKGRHRAERWINFKTNLYRLIEEVDPDIVVYEMVRRHVGTTAAHVYGGFLAHLELLDCQRRSYPRRPRYYANRWEKDLPFVFPIEIGVWKKATTGNGAALKTDVKKFVKKRFRYEAKSEDEADALAIAEAARRIHVGEYTPTKGDYQGLHF